MLEIIYTMKMCTKMLVNKLVEECIGIIDEAKIAKMTLFELENMCNCSCTLYFVLFSIICTINIGIGTYFVCYKYMICNK